jgi:hypothetical protein
MAKIERNREVMKKLDNFIKAVKPGDQLQRYNEAKKEWYLSFTISTEEHVARAFHILLTERHLARVLRPEIVVAQG